MEPIWVVEPVVVRPLPSMPPWFQESTQDQVDKVPKVSRAGERDRSLVPSPVRLLPAGAAEVP
ncbi:MAG: hypothetical protein C4293_03680, partial [Nitrospiraceae bacterium]